MNNSPVGIFDSGFGGLHTLKEIISQLPQYDYLYLGDSARAPYGNKLVKNIYRFTEQAVDFLFKQGCPLVILACNTASSNALRKIQQEYLVQNYPARRVLGVLIPTSESAVKITGNNRVGIMATEATVSSKAFIREIKKLNPQIDIFQQTCPGLVSLIENGWTEEELSSLLSQYWQPLKEQSIDTLILGCTHYGLIRDQVQQVVGPAVKVITEAETLAQKLKDYLTKHSRLEKLISRNSQRTFYTSGPVERFKLAGSKFFGADIEALKVVL